MKKLITAATMLVAAAFGASAQSEIFNSENNVPYLGIRASLDVTCPSDMSIGLTHINNSDNGVGFSVGAIYNVPIIYNLYFEPGVSIYCQNAKLKQGFPGAYDQGFDKVTVGEWGFAIPMQFGYHFDFDVFKLHVFTGPEFGVGIIGRTYYKATIAGKTMKGHESMYGDNGYFNRANAYWRFGTGISYDHYYLAISGAVGMTNWLNKKMDGSLHRNTVNLTLGYNF